MMMMMMMVVVVVVMVVVEHTPLVIDALYSVVCSTQNTTNLYFFFNYTIRYNHMHGYIWNMAS